MELKIEHLCGYIPYDLQTVRIWEDGDRSFGIMQPNDIFMLCQQGTTKHPRKMVLVPLDKLTDAQYAEVGLILNPTYPKTSAMIYAKEWFENRRNIPYGLTASLAAINYLFSIKADIHGLIEKGLALDVTTLPDNPYK